VYATRHDLTNSDNRFFRGVHAACMSSGNSALITAIIMNALRLL